MSINTCLDQPEGSVERIEFANMCVDKYTLIEKNWSKAFILSLKTDLVETFHVLKYEDQKVKN